MQHPEIRVRIVTDGGGVHGLQDANDLTVAKGGVQFEACHNALGGKTFAPSSLPPFVKVVPAGGIALAQAQAEGLAYVKP